MKIIDVIMDGFANQKISQNSEYTKVIKEIVKVEDNLRKILTGEQFELLLRLDDLKNQLSILNEEMLLNYTMDFFKSFYSTKKWTVWFTF